MDDKELMDKVEEIELEESPMVMEEAKKAEKRKGLKGSLLSYIAVALIASLVGGIVSPIAAQGIYGDIPEIYGENIINISPTDSINTVAAVVEKAMSSVVGITTVEVVQDRFYQRDVEGIGSGIIVNSNGYILTNSHVVGDGKAKSINVLFEDGTKLEGKLLWNDNMLDLAIVKVEATGLPVATLGDSDELRVGEISVAIGNPLGLEFQRTVTSGIISGLHRSIRVDGNNTIEDLIQTDASINNGNSGGPLLNSNGDVIGINTAKIKSAEGLGFALPINQAKPIIEQVINTGGYETVLMGISGIGVKEYKSRLGVDLSFDRGIVLLQIGENTPAHKAGLLIGDIIIEIDDLEIDNLTQLKKALYNYEIGDKAKIKIIRANEEKEIVIEFTQVN